MVVGVRLTDGLNGTIVDRPSSPAIQIYTRSETIFILCGAAFFAAWMANGWAQRLGIADKQFTMKDIIYLK